jgi:hypothetical protein
MTGPSRHAAGPVQVTVRIGDGATLAHAERMLGKQLVPSDARPGRHPAT